MRKSVIIIIAALVVLVAAIITLFAVSDKDSLDDSSDPIATKQYVNGEFEAELLDEIIQPAESRFTSVLNSVLSEYKNSDDTESTIQRFNSKTGCKVTVNSGGWIIMQSGEATISVTGKAGDISKGEAVTGTVKMQKNHKYVVYSESTVEISVNEEASFVSAGNVSSVNNVSAFSDVSTADWYYEYVMDAVNLGVMSANSDGAFNPNYNVTVADAIVYAAEMHQLNADGNITLKTDDELWYKNYVEYALDQGIIDSSYAELTEEEMNSAISRKEIAYIFASALSDDQYEEVITVNDDEISDVDENSTYGKYIYKLYRAGIITGSDDGNFNPNNDISRAEVAVLIDNMMNPELRKTDN